MLKKAHLAAMEGNLHCLKYILSNSANTNSLITARNDQVSLPFTKSLSYIFIHLKQNI